MCLAIPARISHFPDADEPLAVADVMGVQRKVSLELLQDDPPRVGDWVLVHVGFAMSKISDQQAREQLEMLALLGESMPDAS